MDDNLDQLLNEILRLATLGFEDDDQRQQALDGIACITADAIEEARND